MAPFSLLGIGVLQYWGAVTSHVGLLGPTLETLHRSPAPVKRMSGQHFAELWVENDLM